MYKNGNSIKREIDNNCIVLFPESVATAKKIDKQTIVEAERLLGRDSKFLFDQLHSRNLSKEDLYDARCL